MTGVDALSAIRLSLIVGLWCTVLGFPPAVAAGWLMARRSFPGKSILSAILLAPLVMPPVVTGLLLLNATGRNSWLGGLLERSGLGIPFTLGGAVLAALVVGFPLYAMAARTAFEAVDPRNEEVSLTLGIPPWRTFLRVTLPLALPGLAAGAVLAFARSLGEFGATAVLAGNIEGETRTISLAVYTLLDSTHSGSGMRILVGASIALSLVALLGFEALVRGQRKRLEVLRDR